MDLFLLQALIDEMAPWIVGRSVGRIDQLGTTDLLLDLHLRDGRRLHLSTDPQRLACYLTERSHKQFPIPSRTDTPFVALMRKHLEGTRLRAIEPLGYDRVVRFLFAEESGDERALIVWLTGRSANLWLVREEQVVASLREREGLGEGSRYADPAPPGDRLDPLAITAEQLRERLRQVSVNLEEEPALVQAIERTLLGFTPRLARELVVRLSGVQPEAEWASGWQAMQAELFPAHPRAYLYADPPWETLQREPGHEEMSLILSTIPFHHLAHLSTTTFESVNEGMARYQAFLAERSRLRTLQQRLVTHLTGRRRKLEALLANLDREATKYQEAERWQREAELLLINAHQAVLTEAGTFRVVNLFDEAQEWIEIESNGKKSPAEAAEAHFRRARKGRHALASIEERRPPVVQELEAIASTREEVLRATSAARMEEIARTLGLAPPTSDRAAARPASAASQRGRGKERGETIPGTRRYRSSDGFEILVGRTDRDNDHLTNRIARSQDLWLHAADYPGSHVILRNPRRLPIPFRSLQEAAQLAAKFSQAKDAPKVAVHYCEKKFVTKPKGFPPGQVRLASFKTILVEPGEPAERLLAN